MLAEILRANEHFKEPWTKCSSAYQAPFSCTALSQLSPGGKEEYLESGGSRDSQKVDRNVFLHCICKSRPAAYVSVSLLRDSR